jgi:hypothetical protein
VPYLLIQEHPREGGSFTHVGSIDIDFVIDPNQVGDEEYHTLVELIQPIGWRGIPGKRFSFERTISARGGDSYDIQVDFLTTAATGSEHGHRHRQLQPDLEARTMRGAELALTHRATRRMEGTLPGGAQTEVEFLMLDVVGCLGTKGIALGERFKQKDAYDIVAILDNFGRGVPEIATLVRPFASETLMREALEVLAAKFGTERSEGPAWCAEFMGGDAGARERQSQRAYQVVSEFCRLVAER